MHSVHLILTVYQLMKEEENLIIGIFEHPKCGSQLTFTIILMSLTLIHIHPIIFFGLLKTHYIFVIIYSPC